VSRIGKIPIAIPKGVEVKLEQTVLSVKGPKGAADLDYRGHVTVRQEDGQIHVQRHSDSIQDRAFHGLYQRLVGNLVSGVTEGFSKKLELVGVGYRAAMDGKTLVLNLGYSHDIKVPPPEGISFATPAPTQIIVSGIDKQVVGQVSANIRGLRPPEPYKGKGIRYAGEKIRRKVGKAGA
jgi:large subunit ribosomal protein L6